MIALPPDTLFIRLHQPLRFSLSMQALRHSAFSAPLFFFRFRAFDAVDIFASSSMRARRALPSSFAIAALLFLPE